MGNGIGVALEGVARLAHAVVQTNTCALLHDVRRLVRRGVQRRAAAERDVFTPSKGHRAQLAVGLACLRPQVSPYAGHIVGAEGLLNGGEERQGLRAAAHSFGSGVVDLYRAPQAASSPWRRLGVSLYPAEIVIEAGPFSRCRVPLDILRTCLCQTLYRLIPG